MQIPLDHPMWTRLPGPYGPVDLSEFLSHLQHSWDQELAEDLFWELMFHQETLYPVTFAALPWVWQMMPLTVGNLCLVSLVMYCSQDGLEAAYTSGGFFPLPSYDTPEDAACVAKCEAWFEDNKPAFSEACLRALPLCKTDQDIADLLQGVAVARGSAVVANLLPLLAGEYVEEDIAECAQEAEASDLRVAKALCEAIAPVSGTLAKALKEVLVLYSAVPVPHAFDEDTDTPELFD